MARACLEIGARGARRKAWEARSREDRASSASMVQYGQRISRMELPATATKWRRSIRDARSSSTAVGEVAVCCCGQESSSQQQLQLQEADLLLAACC